MSDAPTRAVVRDVVIRSQVGTMIGSVSNDPLFELDLDQVDVAYWVDIGQPGTQAIRRHWHAT